MFRALMRHYFVTPGAKKLIIMRLIFFIFQQEI